MAVSIAIVPASGSVHAKISACRVTVSGASDTDSSEYDDEAIPAEPELRYRLVATKSGQQDLVSHEFAVSQDGHHIWDNIIFPATGAWSIGLINQDDDSSAATLAVTVIA